MRQVRVDQAKPKPYAQAASPYQNLQVEKSTRWSGETPGIKHGIWKHNMGTPDRNDKEVC